MSFASSFDNTRSKRTRNRRIIILFIAAIICFVVYAFFSFLETTAPVAAWENQKEFLNNDSVLNINASDLGSGIRSIEVTYTDTKKNVSLYKGDFSSEPAASKGKNIEVKLDPWGRSLKDGNGTITIKVVDRSLWKLGKGNSSQLEYQVTIDTKIPSVQILSYDHVVMQGGAEITVFRGSKDTTTAVVKIGEREFKAYRGIAGGENTYVALFSYPYNISSKIPVFIVAEDRAGNKAKKNLPILIKSKRPRERIISISEDFIERKLPEIMSAERIEPSGDALTDFLAVNNTLRHELSKKITAMTSNSVNEKLWDGGFKSFRNAQVQANFADHRSYRFNGEIVDHQYHLGFDLAAVRLYPIGATNSGNVIFSGYLGIYGNTVIIDHGMGLSTLYSHMSSIDVDNGASVEKGQIIGKTGESGLAGGDHLHYAVLISGLEVTPIEWWDDKWVKNRITRRLRQADQKQ